MNGHNQDNSPSIEVLLGHITALQLIIGGLLGKLQHDGILKENELHRFLDSLGIPPGKHSLLIVVPKFVRLIAITHSSNLGMRYVLF